MLGCGVYTASTKGFKKKFTLSYGIKLFTYYILKKEVKQYFGIKSLEDTPTHAIIYGEKTAMDQLIFEANPTMQLKYDPYGADAGMKKFSYLVMGKQVRDNLAFKNVTKEKVGKIYPFWEFLNFIRRAFWWWLFRRDIKGAHQYFTWLDVCSELVAKDIVLHPLKKTKQELQKIDFNVFSPADLLNVLYVGINSDEILWVK